jgi:hypothetical protein
MVLTACKSDPNAKRKQLRDADSSRVAESAPPSRRPRVAVSHWRLVTDGFDRKAAFAVSATRPSDCSAELDGTPALSDNLRGGAGSQVDGKLGDRLSCLFGVTPEERPTSALRARPRVRYHARLAARHETG